MKLFNSDEFIGGIMSITAFTLLGHAQIPFFVDDVVVNMGIIYLLRIKSVPGWQSIRQRVCRDLCIEQLPIL